MVFVSWAGPRTDCPSPASRTGSLHTQCSPWGTARPRRCRTPPSAPGRSGNPTARSARRATSRPGTTRLRVGGARACFVGCVSGLAGAWQAAAGCVWMCTMSAPHPRPLQRPPRLPATTHALTHTHTHTHTRTRTRTRTRPRTCLAVVFDQALEHARVAVQLRLCCGAQPVDVAPAVRHHTHVVPAAARVAHVRRGGGGGGPPGGGGGCAVSARWHSTHTARTCMLAPAPRHQRCCPCPCTCASALQNASDTHPHTHTHACTRTPSRTRTGSRSGPAPAASAARRGTRPQSWPCPWRPAGTGPLARARA
jgi:hypothetical protein